MIHYAHEDWEAQMLGVPCLADLAEQFLAECKNRQGLTARDMHRQHKHASVVAWMAAAAMLNLDGKVRAEWRPCAKDAPTVQEAVYFLVADAPQE